MIARGKDTLRRRIAVVSEDFAPPWDEGIKKFAWSIGSVLASEHEVRMINVDRNGVGNSDPIVRVPSSRTFVHPRLRSELSRFSPDITLYVPSASSTVSSFLRSFVLRRHSPRSRLGMVALIPRRHRGVLRAMIEGAAPDVVFVPSYQSLLHTHELNLRGELVHVGVDPAVFHPVAVAEKRELRSRYGVREDAYVYLHVGHLSPKRNLSVMAELAREKNVDVIVVGSTSTPEDAALRAELAAAGVRVIREVVPVHEFYWLADCYVFPVVDSEGCVEIPLSVVEAMASGIPVLARPFGGLRDALPAGEDLRYFDLADEFVVHARALRANGAVRVRDMSRFSWKNIADGIIAALDRHA